jgi:heme A synthase
MHHLLELREFISRGLRVTAGFGSLWFISWAIRRKGEFDHPLDFTGQVVRWLLVVVLLGAMTYFPGSSAPRLALLVGGAALLAWPNFAYHLTRLLRWCRILPKAPQPPPDPPSRQHVDDPAD